MDEVGGGEVVACRGFCSFVCSCVCVCVRTGG